MIGQVPNNDDELKKLLEKNLQLTEEIYKMMKSVKHFVTFQKLMSFIYFLIIVVPIVLGIIYLPPLLNKVLAQYQSLLGIASPTGAIDMLQNSGGLDLKNLDLKNLDLKNINPADLLKQ